GASGREERGQSRIIAYLYSSSVTQTVGDGTSIRPPVHGIRPALFRPMPALDQYFRDMLTKNASDFHLSSGNTATFRMGGTMTTVGKEILTADAVKTL